MLCPNPGKQEGTAVMPMTNGHRAQACTTAPITFSDLMDEVLRESYSGRQVHTSGSTPRSDPKGVGTIKWPSITRSRSDAGSRVVGFDVVASGQPFRRDHIDDLALGGTDHPSVMIALCPNCHAAKTHRSEPQVDGATAEAAGTPGPHPHVA